MKTPVLDPRSKQDIMDLLLRRAGEYVPEWRPGGGADPGAALAELFGDMFYQTVDRFNSIPRKAYTEYLNLLGVQVPPVTPAAGFVRFDVSENVLRPVPVPAGTPLYTRDEAGDNIVFETARRVEGTSAQLREVYFSDSRAGVIQRLDMERPQPFFRATDAENLQCHRFTVSQNDVLSVAGPCVVELSITMRARFLEDSTVKRLADPQMAGWSWFDGEKQVPFDSVEAADGVLKLTKRASVPMAPDEDGYISIACDMAPGEGELTVDGLSLRTVPLGDVPADSLANNDIPIPQGDGGYCFGRMPAAYELFYIRSDSAFRKRGALAMLRLDVSPITYTEVDGKPQYTFNKRIIDKSDAVIVKPDDVFVQQVVWEYYNGRGWAKLDVDGNKNPFSGKEEGALQLTFTVPEDTEQVLVNSEMGYYIRARVVNVENSMSINPRWILPFVKNAACFWQYTDSRRAERVTACNNGKLEVIEDAARPGPLALTVFSDLEDHPRSMYLCFDRSPDGMPLSMFFSIQGSSAPESKVIYEAWNGSRFERLRLVDATRNLLHTGPVYLYVTEKVPETELFGETGCWLRMSLSSFSDRDTSCPVIGGISFNVTEAVQRQRTEDEYYSCGVYEAGKVITLGYAPVMTVQVWVDETSNAAVGDMLRMEREQPDSVIVEREGDAVLHCWVRWTQTPALALAGPEDRVFELDSFGGRLMFGNGRTGRVLPQGEQNVRVAYSYGGGARGNLPAGTLTEFLGSVPLISGLVNITPMSGGTDRREPEVTEAFGNRRVRHRGKAVGVRDFEELVAEGFTRAVHVKCFTGRDETGAKAAGHVCLVVMGSDLEGERTSRDLCREIYAYLAERSDCCMVAAGRLHVRPSTDMTVNVAMSVQLRDMDRAAETQQRLSDAVTRLINEVWRGREIGRQIDVAEIYQTVKSVSNVDVIERLSVEGVYYQDGLCRVSPIEDDSEFPYATVSSGVHTVRIF